MSGENFENLPEGWPEGFMAAGETPTCDHYMQWVDTEEHYECIKGCGEVKETPPN